MRFRDNRETPLADAKSARRWLASLPANDPVAIQHAVTQALEPLAERTARRTPASLEAVFAVDLHAEPVAANLVAQYIAHATRSSRIENQLWQVMFALTGAFQACYAAFGREVRDLTRHGRWQLLLPELIARHIVHLGLEAKIRLFRYERWIPAKWVELHTLFTRAFSLQVERKTLLLDPARGPTTIEQKYLAVLLLQLADPGNLTPRQTEWVAAQLDEWCRPLRFTVAPRSATTFYVDLSGSAGLRRRTLAPLEGRVLFVDTLPLHAQLLENRAALEQAVRSDPLSRKTPQQREQLELFVKLASRIDPESRPIVRRGERVPASGGVDAIIGFDAISGFMRPDVPVSAPYPDVSARGNFSSTMELAVFGRARVVAEPRVDPVRRRLAAFAAPGGPWELKDVSSSGFRLTAPMSVATEVRLSTLLAIDRCGENAWVLGIVRRMRRLSAAEAEIGLQLIANAIASVTLVPRRTPRDEDAPGTAGPASIADRGFHGLYLSFSRRPGESVVQSLIVPQAEYRPGRRYTMRVADGERVIRYGRLLEQHTDWVWAVVDPLDAGAGSDATPREP